MRGKQSKKSGAESSGAAVKANVCGQADRRREILANAANRAHAITQQALVDARITICEAVQRRCGAGKKNMCKL
jgi:hypothetical protein